MEIGAIVTSLIAVVGLVYSAIRIAHDKAPLRRFERLAATRGQLEPGSRELKLTDQALLDLARSVAYKESGKGNLRVAEMTFLYVMVFGTLAVAVSTELSKNENVPVRVTGLLFVMGVTLFSASLLGATVIMTIQIAKWIGLRKYRHSRRLIMRARARQAKLKRKSLRPQAVTKMKALKKGRPTATRRLG